MCYIDYILILKWMHNRNKGFPYKKLRIREEARMKKIPITLEQYQCISCGRKWYVNTQDKIGNEMTCPYNCECIGNLTRKFDMIINNYEEYAQESSSDE